MTRRNFIVAWGLLVAGAALYTGVTFGLAGRTFFKTSMIGFLPWHYGYSAYAVVPLLFLGPRWARWVGGVTLLLSANRAAWVGVIAGWAWAGGRRRLALAGILALLAVVGGNALKDYGARGDSARVHIWKAAIKEANRHPLTGVGERGWLIGVHGYAVTKAHSDVLQLAVDHGWLVAGLAVLLFGLAFYRLPESPEKALVLALSVQSVINNYLHHPACAALYVAVWIAAMRARDRAQL